MFSTLTLITCVIITSVLCSPYQYPGQQQGSISYSGQSGHHHMPSQPQGSITYSNPSRPHYMPPQQQGSISYSNPSSRQHYYPNQQQGSIDYYSNHYTNDEDSRVRPQSHITYQRTVRDLGFYKSDCTSGVEEGEEICRAEIPVYTWDNATQKCKVAFYGGCNKTRNNFRTLQDCERVAKPVCTS